MVDRSQEECRTHGRGRERRWRGNARGRMLLTYRTRVRVVGESLLNWHDTNQRDHAGVLRHSEVMLFLRWSQAIRSPPEGSNIPYLGSVTVAKSFERGRITDWQGGRGILQIESSEAWFFVRAYNMEPDGRDLPVKVGEAVAFEWIHEGRRMIVARCVRLDYGSLPNDWALQEWPPAVEKWTPVACLGKGLNGEVWRATGAANKEIAIKYVHRATDVAYKRFRAEVELNRKLQGMRGVLPVLDYRLPIELSLENPAWLAMPLAIPFMESPAVATLESLVSGFVQIAEVLAELAARGIAHRDIKPDNLFWFEGAAAVGDFGLADFPGKEALTAPIDKLGPTFYLAPEMLNEPHLSDGRPADVYSLAKSLWVLATGQRYPIPGAHTDIVYQTRLSTYVRHSHARFLDALIARCTRHDPRERPGMEEFAGELRAWMERPRASRPRRPRSCTDRELSKVGVQLTDDQYLILHCVQCGQGWSPNLRRGGKLPYGYWRCPNGCNR